MHHRLAVDVTGTSTGTLTSRARIPRTSHHRPVGPRASGPAEILTGRGKGTGRPAPRTPGRA